MREIEAMLALGLVAIVVACRPENEIATGLRSLQFSLQRKVSSAAVSVRQESAQRLLVTLEVERLSEADSVRATELSQLICTEAFAPAASIAFDTVKVLIWTDRALGLPIPFGYSFVRHEGCPDTGESSATPSESTTSRTNGDE